MEDLGWQNPQVCLFKIHFRYPKFSLFNSWLNTGFGHVPKGLCIPVKTHSYGKSFFNITLRKSQLLQDVLSHQEGRREPVQAQAQSFPPLLPRTFFVFPFKLPLKVALPKEGMREDSREWSSLAQDVLKGIPHLLRMF